MKHIFVALIEVRPLEGCEIDPTLYDGAAVRCYIPAADEITARTLLRTTLDQDCFQLVEEEFFVRDDLVEWEHPENDDARTAVAEASKTGLVVYSEFRAWDHTDPESRKNKKCEQAGTSNGG
jgi:hypothetical protein